MNVLVTTSRMPFSIDVIRKLGEAGHRVFATDTYGTAPGSHSKWVRRAVVTSSPRWHSRRFVAEIVELVRAEGIELVVPCFEEVFYLAAHGEQLSRWTRLSAPPFSTLRCLHDKAELVGLSRELGVPVPRSTIAATPDALRAAIRSFPRYLARPSHSRGGVHILTNAGPLAGAMTVDDCRPSAENPWIAQEFLDGTDVCTFTVARHGRVRAHVTYVHPSTIDHGGGIVLESIAHPTALRTVEQFVEATGYHGQIAFDFIERDGVLHALECNPRPTAGVALMSTSMFVGALLDDAPAGPAVVQPGVRRKMSAALVRDMLLNWRNIPANLRALLSDAEDIYARRGDMLPALFQLLAYGQVKRYRRHLGARRRRRTDLAASHFFDVLWDGQPIP